MGIYDGGYGPWNRAKVVLALLLLLAIAYLLLPPPFYVTTSLDVDVAKPGDHVKMWIRIGNNMNIPLSGVYVVARSSSPYVDVNLSQIVPDVPPGGVVIVPVDISVRGDAIGGDHLLEIFVSVPGRTDVVYQQVKVG